MGKVENVQYVKLYILLIPIFCSISWVGSHSASSEEQLSESQSNEGGLCENELSSEFCQNLAESASCPGFSEDSPLKNGCRKSCGYCADSDSIEEPTTERSDVHERALEEGGCEDKIPNCDSYLSLCSSMKDAMNTSCAKTCKFCSETPATMPPSAPGGAPAPPGGGGLPAPTASSNQDPCSPTNPPSVTVDAPGPGAGVPGQTTTTAAPGANLPGMG